MYKSLDGESEATGDREGDCDGDRDGEPESDGLSEATGDREGDWDVDWDADGDGSLSFFGIDFLHFLHQSFWFCAPECVFALIFEIKEHKA